MNHAFLIELVDGFGTQTVYVHRLTAHKMFDFTLDLWRARSVVGAIMGSFALITGQRTTAFRTFGDETNLVAQHETGFLIHPYNLRNDFSSLFHIYHIAQAQVQAFDDIGIVQRGALHNRTCQLHRIQIGHRSHGSCTTYLIGNAVQTGTSPFCLEFIGNRPTGRLGCIAQIPLLAERIYLQNDTIRCHREVLAFHIPISDKLQHFLQSSTFAHDIAHLEAPPGSQLHVFIMSVTRKLIGQQII